MYYIGLFYKRRKLCKQVVCWLVGWLVGRLVYKGREGEGKGVEEEEKVQSLPT